MAREMKDQLLDSMDLERERGITIKCHPVSMTYRAKDGNEYLFNLIDTPGHVDFSYEVSRSLAACEGHCSCRCVSGSRGSDFGQRKLADAQGLDIIPVINKVDLPSADVDRVSQQIEDILAIPAEDAIQASGKSGIGVEEILEAVVHRLPPPRWTEHPKPRALVFDNQFDAFKGVICYVRVFSGQFPKSGSLVLMSDSRKTQIKELGKFCPQPVPHDSLAEGEVGYVVTGIRDEGDQNRGYPTLADSAAEEMLPGYKEVRPMVFSGLYPIDTSDYEKLKKSGANFVSTTRLSPSNPRHPLPLVLVFVVVSWALHMEIVQERLRREYDIDLISTYPSVVYRVHLTAGEFLRSTTHLNCLTGPRS